MKKILILISSLLVYSTLVIAQQTKDFPKSTESLESKRFAGSATPVEKNKARTTDSDQLFESTRTQQTMEYAIVSRRKNNDIPSTHARIHLMVDSVNKDRYGYQLLFDNTAKGYGDFIPKGEYDDLGGFGQSVSDSLYALFSHKIPANANGLLETKNVIFNDSVYLDIPEGLYDLCMTNPTKSYISIPFKARINDYNFVGGYEYFFIVYKGSYSGAGRFEYPILGQLMAKAGPTSSLLGANETLSVIVKNNGFLNEGLNNCQISYTVNNGPIVSETLATGPAAGKSIVYGFNQKVDMSTPGKYAIKMWLTLPDAIHHAMDTIVDSVFSHVAASLPIIDSFPNTEEFNFKSKWATLDANGDGVSWIFDKWEDADGDKNSGTTRYFYSPTLVADDYLISKPFNASVGDHHVRFEFHGRGESKEEELEVYFGTSPKPEDMTLLGGITFSKVKNFRPYVRNFTISQAGVYYIAIRAKSIANAYGMNLDNLKIAAGRAQNEPNVSIVRGRLPYASCDMTNTSTIGIELVNNGTNEAESYTVSYTLNGGSPVSQTFTDQIPPYKSKIVYFDTKADLSQEKDYIVKFEVNVNGQTTPIQPHESSTHHLSSVQIPYSSRVSTTEGAKDYYSVVEGHWVYDNGAYRTNSEWKFPLVSRCFYSEAQLVRFSFDFTAGGENMWGPTPDDIMILLGKSGSDRSSWDTIAVLKNQYFETFATGAVKFNIPEAGNYVLAIEPHRSPTSIKIGSFMIEKVYENNLQALYLTAPNMGSIMPESQIATQHLLIGYIRNYGRDTVHDAGFSLKQGSIDLGNSITTDTLAPNASVSIQKVVTFSKVPATDSLRLTMTTRMKEADHLTSDNNAHLNIAVSDSVYALDTYRFLTNEPYDAIGGKKAIRLGSIFNITTTDTITSVSIGFAEATGIRNFRLAMYKISAPPAAGEQVFEIDARRPAAAGLYTFAVPASIVTPGMWYIEVQQLNSDNVFILTDLNPNGILYQNSGGNLSYINTRGYMVIRGNFGRSNATILTKDASVESIHNLRTEGVYTNKETITARVKNLSSSDLNGKIICTVDGVNAQEKSVKLLAYEKKEVNFVVDLSTLGEHQVKIVVQYTGDQNAENDELSKTFTCVKVNPYVLNFEESADFSIDALVPAWTMYDGDSTKSFIFDGINFPNDTVAKAFLVFNPSLTTPSSFGFDDFSTFEGERCGMAMAVTGKRNNDWLISPKLKMGLETKLKFQAASLGLGFGNEQINVLVSTTDNKLSSFTRIGDTLSIDSAWHAYTVDLSAYNDKEIHVAIQCVSNDVLVLKIDNIEIDTDLGVSLRPDKQAQFAMSLYPNPAQDKVTITSEYAIRTVQVIDAMGRNLHMIRNNSEVKEMVLPVKALGKGIFYIMIDTPMGQQTQKLIVQ